MSETFEYLKTFASFPVALRRFAQRGTLSLNQARRIVGERMARREENFLALLERGVYGWPRSPYLPLLRQAGCELGDVRARVKQAGLEQALRELREAGVYVTFEEFKGRKPLQRGGVELAVRGRDFDNPLARRALMIRTGGTTGAAHAVGVDLDNIADRAAQRLVFLAAHGLVGAPTLKWQGILPVGDVKNLLFGNLVGNMPRRWISPVGWRDSRQWVKYGLGTYYLLLCMRLAGLRPPLPEYLDKTGEAQAIARWAAETVKTQGRCLILAGVSRGARLGMAAQDAGLDLSGVTLLGAGEPPTPAKVGQMNCVGMRYIPTYGMSDAGMVGQGCAKPIDATDVHVFKDGFLLTTHPRWVEDYNLSVPALNLTSLLLSSSKLLINVELDDYGIVEERNCGCELEACGYFTHVRQVRSYTKLTGEGVTLIGSEMQRLLEEGLPARFGGGPLDYQLLEEEDEHSQTRLYLLVHPRLEIADEHAVIQTLMDSLGRSSPMADAARILWENEGTIKVRRAEPLWSARGKLLPLYVRRLDGK